MMNDEDARRKFDQIVAGLDLTGLQDLVGAFARQRMNEFVHPPRQRLRHPRRDEVVILRVRADVMGEKPPIWRRLDLRSDLTLDAVHDVLQAAFGWADAHLYRFSLGGGPWDRTSELFLCPYDIEEGEDEGLPTSDVRLDETLTTPGDVLHYVYDYGDDWAVTIRLEEVRDAVNLSTPLAACVTGRRAAPPESSRGLESADLFALQGDPDAFDPDEVNEALRDLRFRLRGAGVTASVISLVDRLRYLPRGDEVERFAEALLEPVEPKASVERDAALGAWRWFLDRADGDGIALTSAGYLAPADVVEACAAVPTMGPWIGKNNREAHSGPLLHFRQSLISHGLLRKYRGKLLLTRAGAAARRDSGHLWETLVNRWRGVVAGTHRVPQGRSGSEAYARDATTCVLLAVAGGAGLDVELLPRPGRAVSAGLDLAARWLTDLGWRHGVDPIRGTQLYSEPVLDVLENLWVGPRALDDRGEMSAVARTFARDVLRGKD